MKSIKTFLAIAAIALFSISCNNDDDPKPEYANKIAGAYNGNLELTVGGASQGSVDSYSATVTRISQDSVTILLSKFNFRTYSIPDITIGSKIVQNNGEYELSGLLNASSDNFNITGDFNGSSNGTALNLTINYQFGAMPMPVVGNFTGTLAQSSMTVDVSDYSKWTYINLKTGEMQTLRDFNAWNYIFNGAVDSTTTAQGSENDITIDWHIAIHRYDIRTNGGAAVATTETTMGNVTTMPTSGYASDETVENTIVTDMARMMTGIVGYAATAQKSQTLSAWLTKTPTGTMPPYTYEPTNLIYVVKCSDGNYAKLKFTDYQNSEGTSGYVTFMYEFVNK